MRLPSRLCPTHCSLPFHSFPPTTVARTSVSGISKSSISNRSLWMTMKSASLPTSSEPTRSSWNEAKAAPVVKPRRVSASERASLGYLREVEKRSATAQRGGGAPSQADPHSPSLLAVRRVAVEPLASCSSVDAEEGGHLLDWEVTAEGDGRSSAVRRAVGQRSALQGVLE